MATVCDGKAKPKERAKEGFLQQPRKTKQLKTKATGKKKNGTSTKSASW
jgi:hypothetical protein